MWWGGENQLINSKMAGPDSIFHSKIGQDSIFGFREILERRRKMWWSGDRREVSKGIVTELKSAEKRVHVFVWGLLDDAIIDEHLFSSALAVGDWIECVVCLLSK